MSLVAELLWTNENPSADFSAQTINIDLSSYKKILISYTMQVKNSVASSKEMYKNTIDGFYLTGYIARQVEILEDKIIIGNAQSGDGNFNYFGIPMYIYGLK